ncbi:MAG: peptide-methionine (S)-S-oxide reductase [Planctomycetes bacterium]|nr:peptide-methionine (S)-S-oxide reductase [Planctomycetota bacterium]
MLPGVVRTRVGYCGGTTPEPTYRSNGDHTETVQIDFDPAKIAYERLLDLFWETHNPCLRPYSRQYASIVFVHDEKQRASAIESRERAETKLGTKVTTEFLPFKRFFIAEDYHQKYYLRSSLVLMREFAVLYRDPKEFVASTASARVNGYLGGHGRRADLEVEIDRYGLSPDGRRALLAAARSE